MALDDMTRKIVDEAMKHPSARIELFKSMKKNVRGEFEPTTARTIIIHVDGGANNVLIRSLKTEDDEADDEAASKR